MVEPFDEILGTENSSRLGCYFVSTNPAYKKFLRLFIVLPYSSAPGAINREYVGEVVRIDELPNGRRGIAVKFVTTIAFESHEKVPAIHGRKKLWQAGPTS
jgi:hypothetical protein